MKANTAILAALLFALTSANGFALDPHVEAVIRAVEGAKGKVEKTEDGKSLKLVDLAVPGAGPGRLRDWGTAVAAKRERREAALPPPAPAPAPAH